MPCMVFPEMKVYNKSGNMDRRVRILMMFILFTAILFLVTGCFNLPPVASITAFPTSGIEPLVVTFDASGSSDPDGYIVSYQWVFGDRTTGSGKTRQHLYATAGTYIATLTVRDDYGATDATSVTISIYPDTTVAQR